MKRSRKNLYLPTHGSPAEQENRIAQKLGGKRVKGSGSSIYSKGDVRDVAALSGEGLEDTEFLVECKQTSKASISIKWDWLRKITREANGVLKQPMLTIEIKGGQGDPLCDRDWVMVPARVWEKLIG